MTAIHTKLAVLGIYLASGSFVFSGSTIGSRPPEVDSLRDIRGNARSLREFKDSSAVVVAFVSTQCPIAKLYLPGLIELEKKYRERRVAFVAVYPQSSESVDEVAASAYERGVPFLVVKDFGGKLAETLGVERVPTVCVLDATGTLRYRGRIDDQYGAASRKPAATRHDLVEAIDEVVAGKEVSSPETPADGCLLSKTKATGKSSGVTYAKDVARILQNRCEECHRAGRIGPFTLASYEDAAGHAEMIREVVEQRRMPPWHADPRYGRFHNDRRLTDAELETVLAWIDAGAPKGDEKDLPPKRQWVEGWEMGQPDVVLKVSKATPVPATGVVPYKYLIVPSGFTEDKWVVAAEGKPGDPAVVHHIIIYIMSPERLNPFEGQTRDMAVLTAWAPGDGPFLAAPGTALRVPKGSTLLFEMHYTPNGKETMDQSMVGIKFADKPPERMVRANFFGNEAIAIPANDPHHSEERDFVFEQDSRILSFLPHMHWRGKHFEYIATYPDGRKEVLLSVPRWDFNWQTGYWLAEPLAVKKGTRVRAICHWDNSKYNPANPDPTKEVHWGLQTWDEMMVGWLYYVHEQPDADVRPREADKMMSASMFKILDRDKNGWVQGKEIPKRFGAIFDEIGFDQEMGLDPVSFEFIFRSVIGREGEGDRDKGGRSEKKRDPQVSQIPPMKK